MRQAGIYGWKNSVNGKWYIGQSIDPEDRRKEHLQSLRAGRHYNKRWQEDFRFLGETAFEHHLIEECSPETLDTRERVWVAYYKSDQPEFGYNQTHGGNSVGMHTKETKAKISATLKGRRNTAEQIARFSAVRKGHLTSLETRAKMSAARKGKKIIGRKPPTPETCMKISATLKGRKRPLEICAKIAATKKNNPYIASEETRAKISAGLKGRLVSPETKAKISFAIKKLNLSKKATVEATQHNLLSSLLPHS